MVSIPSKHNNTIKTSAS